MGTEIKGIQDNFKQFFINMGILFQLQEGTKKTHIVYTYRNRNIFKDMYKY